MRPYVIGGGARQVRQASSAAPTPHPPVVRQEDVHRSCRNTNIKATSTRLKAMTVLAGCFLVPQNLFPELRRPWSPVDEVRPVAASCVYMIQPHFGAGRGERETDIASPPCPPSSPPGRGCQRLLEPHVLWGFLCHFCFSISGQRPYP